MGVSILAGGDGAVLYCNTTNWAFGPIFNSRKEADEFRQWVDDDPRSYSDSVLEQKYGEWSRTRGLGFDSEDEREAFIDWLSEDVSDYELYVLEGVYTEWKRTMWESDE